MDQERAYVSQYRGHTIEVQRFQTGYGDWQWCYAVDNRTGNGTADYKRDALRWARQYVDGLMD